MVCSDKVFLLITFSLSCHHGHLHFLNLCHPSSGSSSFCTQNLMTLLSYLRLRQRNF
nr:uncharacterized protein LOC107842930 [Ipomoea batatas]